MSWLIKGDTVGIIAPSVGLMDKDIEPTIAYFKQLGLKVELASNIDSSYRYMAGSDIERAKQINKMFRNKKIKALFCLRGGAGATRMLDYLDYDIIRENQKPIIGLSDSTAIQNALFTLCKNPSFTGFLPLYDLKDGGINNVVDSSLRKSLFEGKNAIKSGNALICGNAKGKIVGGCLSVFLYLCGTKYFPNLAGKILLLEELGEKTYKIDMMLNQLKQQKGFDKLKGIILGKFENCKIIDKEDGTINDCINDFVKGLNIPVITDFDYGHVSSRYVLPIGIDVRLEVSSKECLVKW